MVVPRCLVPSLALMVSAASPMAVQAAESVTVGPRSLGMGGSGVAVANGDTASQLLNPAVFGYFGLRGEDDVRLLSDNHNLGAKRFGIGITDFTVGYHARGRIGDLADDVLDMLERIEDINDKSNANIDLNADDVRDSVKVITRLVQLDSPDNVVAVDVNGGFSLRTGHIGIGLRGFGQAIAFIDRLDTTNMGFDDPNGTLNDELTEYLTEIGYTGGTNVGVNYTPDNISADQVSALSAGGFDQEAIVAIDLLLTDPEVANDFSDQEVQDFLDLAVDIEAAGGGGGDLDDNNTTVAAVGFAGAEIPVTYGRQVFPGLSVGVTGKLMFAEVGAKVLRVFDDEVEEQLEEVLDETESSTTFGVDLGVMYRMPNLQFGIVGKNLNSPEFDGPTVTVNQVVNGNPVLTERQFNSVTLEPQVTIGAAWVPTRAISVTVEADILEIDAPIGIHKQQYIRGGIEFDLALVSLRAGGYINNAESNEDLVVTVGVGVDVWLLRFDLAGAVSTDTTSYDGDDVPTAARVSLGVAMDF